MSECDLCVSGKYSTSGASECLNCPNGKYTGDAGLGDAQTSDMASEGMGAASVAAPNSGDSDDVKPARQRGRQHGKSAAAADDADAASKQAADALSPAQFVEVVQDKVVAS